MKSKELNIDMIGFTAASTLDNMQEYLEYRQNTKKVTEFEEKDIKKRIDPKLTMPNCKTIIVIAISYNVDYNEKLARDYNVFSIPCLVLIENGKEVNRSVGMIPKSEVEKLIGEKICTI